MKPCPDTFPFPLVALDETASTNQYLSQLCNQLQESVAELTTVTAEFQTAGKGQRGNTWEAEEGKNLLFSFVLYPSFLEARRQFILSQIVSLAIKEELSRWSDEITIKWPNDIYWKDKKICGILIENDLSGHHIRRSIAGIGININQEVFNSDAPNPVSLKQITGKEHDRYEILAHILRRVQIYYNSLQMEDFAVYSDEISTRYARSLFRRRGLHPYEDANGKFLARLLRVEQDGRFVLEDEGGSEREYLFKEVQYILLRRFIPITKFILKFICHAITSQGRNHLCQTSCLSQTFGTHHRTSDTDGNHPPDALPSTTINCVKKRTTG